MDHCLQGSGDLDHVRQTNGPEYHSIFYGFLMIF